MIKGSADLIGWKTVVITPEMVGQKVAIFVSIETKTEEGYLEPHQRTWIENVRAAGGIAGCARSVEQAWRLINGEETEVRTVRRKRKDKQVD